MPRGSIRVLTLHTVPYRTFPLAGRRGTTVLDRSTAYPLFGERAGRVALELVSAARSTSSTASARACSATPAQRRTVDAPLVLNPQGLEEFGATDPPRARLKRAAYLPLRRRCACCAQAADAVIATDRALEPWCCTISTSRPTAIATIPNALDLRWLDGLADYGGRRAPAPRSRHRRATCRAPQRRPARGEQGLPRALPRARRAAGSSPRAIAAGRWRWVLVGDGPYRPRSRRAVARRRHRSEHVCSPAALDDADAARVVRGGDALRPPDALRRQLARHARGDGAPPRRRRHARPAGCPTRSGPA